MRFRISLKSRHVSSRLRSKANTMSSVAVRWLDELYGHLLEGRAFGEAANTTLDRLFLDFSTLGGMPEVVERYFVKGTFEGVPAIQRRIVNDYRSDVRKYAEGLDPVRIVNVFDSIPGQLAKENKKFQLSHVEKKARYKDYWGCVEWLADAGIVNVCKAMDFPELPVAAHLDALCFKLYMADSGLLISMLDEESQEDVRLRRNLGTWKGGLFENIVAEALVKSGVEPVYYKKENSTLEMDFFLRSGDDLVPVEVKAGNTKAKSLRTLLDSAHYKDIRWGISADHSPVVCVLPAKIDERDFSDVFPNKLLRQSMNTRTVTQCGWSENESKKTVPRKFRRLGRRRVLRGGGG